jgi:hypothetical protein
MSADEISRLKRDVALARALLDEVERGPGADVRVVSQLVEELARVVAVLAAGLPSMRPSSSG